MIDARFVPLTQWPILPTRNRKKDPFSATYLQTLDLLETELRYLSAKEILVQAFFSREQIRNDGWPKAGAVPSQPGAIVSFASRGNHLSFPCDRYLRLDANMRAIALSLQALRAVDRYGVTQRSEQYQGWAQIEAPLPGGFRSAEEAAVFLATQCEDGAPEASARLIIDDADLRKLYYRDAAARLHPDKTGGDHELFVRLQQAMAILEGK